MLSQIILHVTLTQFWKTNFIFKLIDSGVLLSKTVWNKEQFCSICFFKNILELITGILEILCMFFILRMKHLLITFPKENIKELWCIARFGTICTI